MKSSMLSKDLAQNPKDLAQIQKKEPRSPGARRGYPSPLNTDTIFPDKTFSS